MPTLLDTIKNHISDSEAWTCLEEKGGLPNKQHHRFREASLHKLYNSSFSIASNGTGFVLPKQGCISSPNLLVFQDGLFSQKDSSISPDLLLLSLAEAKKTYGHFLSPRIARLYKEENNPFALLNASVSSDAQVLYIPPRTSVQLKIQHCSTAEGSFIASYPRMHFIIGKEATLNCSFLFETTGYINNFLDFSLDERASASCVVSFSEKKDSWVFNAIRTSLKQNSNFSSFLLSEGKGVSHQDFIVKLLEEGAESSLYGLTTAEETSHHYTRVTMEHLAPHCRSWQKFKTILKEASRTTFEGKIYVHPQAQKTEAYQINQNLLLTKQAQAKSLPKLEIFADDVKASHGATFGQLDKELLFYLQTRGMSQEQAKQLLIESFSQEIVALIPSHDLSE